MSRPLLRSDALAAFQHRNFRLLWFGLLLSFTGGFMQNTALLWHVATLAPEGRKGLALGALGLARLGPLLLVALMGGAAADAMSRRRLMIATQGAAALVALTLALLAAAGLQHTAPLYVLAAAGSAINVFDLAARQALVPTLVPRSHLPNALSLTAVMIQVASAAGPALAGVVIASGGLATAYLLNALSFAGIVAALLRMEETRESAPTRTEAAGPRVSAAAITEGLHFVFSRPLVRATTILDFTTTFFSPAIVLLPIYAQDVLQLDARGYGWLAAAPAAGALAASAVLVPLARRVERGGRVLLLASTAFALATLGFGLSRSFAAALAALIVMGAADSVGMVVRNLVRQLDTPDHLRGRTTAVTRVFFQGGRQLGEAEAGLAAQFIGAPLAVLLSGAGCLLTTAWIAAALPALRRYRTSVAVSGHDQLRS